MREDVLVRLPALNFLHRLDFLAPFFRLVVLLSILMQAMMPFAGWTFRLPRAGITRLATLLEHLDEALMGSLTVLPLGVTLRARAVPFPVSH